MLLTYILFIRPRIFVFFLIFLFVWLLFASFIFLHIRSGVRRNNLLNKRVQDLLDSSSERSDIREEYAHSESNVIRIDPRTGTYRKL